MTMIEKTADEFEFFNFPFYNLYESFRIDEIVYNTSRLWVEFSGKSKGNIISA